MVSENENVEHKTIDATLIQRDVNKWPCIL